MNAPAYAGSDKQFAPTDLPAEATKRGKPSTADLEAVTNAIWMSWFQHLGLLLLGLSVGFIAWRASRHWELVILGMSILYLALVAFRYISSDRAVLELMQLNLRLIEVGVSNGSFVRPTRIVLGEILMPAFQAVVLLWVLRRYSKGRDSAATNPTPQ